MNLTRAITSIFLIINFQVWSKDALDSKFQIDNNAVVPQIGYIGMSVTFLCEKQKTKRTPPFKLNQFCMCYEKSEICVQDLFSEPSGNSKRSGKIVTKSNDARDEIYYFSDEKVSSDHINDCVKDGDKKEQNIAKCVDMVKLEEDLKASDFGDGHWQCPTCHSYVDRKDGWVKLPKEPFKQEVWLDYKNSYFYQREKPLRGDIIVADGAEAIDVKTNLKITLNAHKEWGMICVRLLKVEGEQAYVTRSIVSYQGGWCSDITRNIYKPGECTTDEKVCDKSRAICSTLMKDYEILKIPTSAFLGKNGHVLGWCRDPENMDM